MQKEEEQNEKEEGAQEKETVGTEWEIRKNLKAL